MADGQRRVRAGDIDLAYHVSGDEQAPPMVLLHALGERGADWDGVGRRLAERYRVYAPDLRGHGDSDWPGDYSFWLMRDDVLGFLDALGQERIAEAGRLMPDCTVVTIPAGHLVHAAEPGLFAGAVLNWLSRSGSQTRRSPGTGSGSGSRRRCNHTYSSTSGTTRPPRP
ncbi:MAG TPA: alpha/beta fold hydrolase [Streptosporangiaceae bacterium]